MSPEIIIRDGEEEVKVEITRSTLGNVRHVLFKAYLDTPMSLNRTLSAELHKLFEAVGQVLGSDEH